MSLSIIIPTLNEAASLTRLLPFLQEQIGGNQGVEIVLVDGGSVDATVQIARKMGVVVLESKQAQRAHQMNVGGRWATAEILYFLHADTFPPIDFLAEIEAAVQAKKLAGCFRLSFDWQHWFLRCHSWFTRFNWDGFHYGDQSLFVRRDIFEAMCGFDESLEIMEDYDLVRRLKQQGAFVVLGKSVVTSARRYRAVGVFRLQLLYYLIFVLFRIGVSQRNLGKVYRLCFH
ncbi:MAG: TIGR04283 family arsenosugar biosynthesis glycosyltransferase [Saprospiraceae bacterium]|nr:TIGR04283 family arsenosugar biosynthesis glycosyltransferase [Saprospiraceae bacterium]